MTFPLILVATDFSPLSQRAADFAANLAGLSSAHLCLIHVVQPIETPGNLDEEDQAFHDELLAKANARLEAEVERLGGKNVTFRAELGGRAKTMLKAVQELQPMMLVMGSSIQEWPNTHRVGVSLQFLVQAPCPVLFVP